MTDGDRDTLIEGEELILTALTDAMLAGKLPYVHYSPAYDVTTARLAALHYAARRPAPAHPEAQDTSATEGEGA